MVIITVVKLIIFILTLLQHHHYYYHYRSLLDIISAMQNQMGVNSLIFTITQRTTRVVDADRCTLYLVDNVQRYVRLYYYYYYKLELDLRFYNWY